MHSGYLESAPATAPTPLQQALLDPELTRQAESLSSRWAAYEISDSLGIASTVYELDEESFRTLYDPTLPTLGIDARHSFSGAELLGMANSRQTDRAFNIVYVNTTTADLAVTGSNGKRHLTADRGYIIDPEGNVASGEFPTPVTVTALETVDLELLDNLRNLGVTTLSQPDSLRYFNDKTHVAAMGAEAGIVTPRRLQPSELTTATDAVIKPSKESVGRGVYFTVQHGKKPEAWSKYYTFLEQHDYEPVIEERVRCWPVRDPKSGEQLDWNVRAIVSNGEFVDMYVRAGAAASAVNKSTGARAIPLDRFHKFVADSGASARILTETLRNAATAFAERYPDFMNGLDLTIDDRGQVVMFETNAGHVGGLQTMANISNRSLNRKLRNAEKLLQTLTPTLGSQRPPQNTSDVSTLLEPTFTAMLDFAVMTQNEFLLSDELPRLPKQANYSRLAHMMTLIATANIHGSTLADETDLVQQLLHKYPFELAEEAHRLSPWVLGTAAVSSSVETYLAADPDSRSWQDMHKLVNATQGDIRQTAHVFREFIRADKRPEAPHLLLHVAHGLEPIFTDIVDKAENMKARTAVSVLLTSALLQEDFDKPSELAKSAASLAESFTNEKQHVALNNALLYLYVVTGHYDHATTVAEKIDIQSEDSEYLMRLLNDRSEELQTTESGKLFHIDQSARFGSLAIALDDMLSQSREGTEHSDQVVARLVDFYALDSSETDREYLTIALSAALQKSAEIEQPSDINSAVQVFGFIIWLRQHLSYEDTMQHFCGEMSDLRLRGDLDFIMDCWKHAD